MTKSELVDLVADRLETLTRKDAEIIIDTIFDGIADTLTKGDRVEIRGLEASVLKIKRHARGGIQKQEKLFRFLLNVRHPSKFVRISLSGLMGSAPDWIAIYH